MFTTDFSRAPVQGRGAAVVLVEGRSSARRRDGVMWRTRVRDGSIRAELLVLDDVAAAERVAAEHPGRSRVLIAEERGYSNGVWRAEEQTPMAHNERFHPVADEAAAGREPPLVAGGRRPANDPKPPGPRRWTLFDSESLFLGATRYRHPIAWAVTNRYWWRMVARMRRMPGSVWHGVYWEWPFTLGTIASFRTRDDLMRFARLPEHRHLMQWVVRDTTNATAGFIRLYASPRELERQAVVAERSAGRGAGERGAVAQVAEQGAGTRASASATASPPSSGATTSGGAARAAVAEPDDVLTLEVVETEAQFQEFLALPRRSDPPALAVPLLEATARAWRDGSSAAPEPVELLLARRDGLAVARTTRHTDRALDRKLSSRLSLFGATWASSPEELRALLDALAARAADDGADELLGPVALLPNQTGGVIASGFAERGFFDSAWNPAWVPAVYEDAGFEPWNVSDTWIARFDEDAGPGARAAADATTAPSETELREAGIRIVPASRFGLRRQVERLRDLTNRSFADLPYYTEISPAQMRDATDGLVALMDPRLWLTALDAGTGDAIGFVLVVPDPTELLQASGGRVGAREAIELLTGGRRRGREAVLLIQGVVPERQGEGISTLLGRAVGAALRDGGYRALRSTYIGRGNRGSARQLERLGGEPLHETVFYRRRTDGRARGSAT